MHCCQLDVEPGPPGLAEKLGTSKVLTEPPPQKSLPLEQQQDPTLRSRTRTPHFYTPSSPKKLRFHTKPWTPADDTALIGAITELGMPYPAWHAVLGDAGGKVEPYCVRMFEREYKGTAKYEIGTRWEDVAKKVGRGVEESHIHVEKNLQNTMPPQPGSGKFKVGLSSVLSDECKPPFSLADFTEHLKKEHSEENLEFWQAVMRYRDNAQPIFPNTSLRTRRFGSAASLRSNNTLSGSQSVANRGGSAGEMTSGGGAAGGDEDAGAREPDTMEEKLSKLRDELDVIAAVYLTPGSDREINLPATTRKKLLAEIEKKNYHPDIFKGTMEHMKTSSYPAFYRSSCQVAQQKGLIIGERKASAASSVTQPAQ
ncbi:hypothetical protein HK104_008047 [Borealophlyctis nickersoniae]|nr:hypothetical protein HK104_008047 [Borealophlyctis nickersoniae]